VPDPGARSFMLDGGVEVVLVERPDLPVVSLDLDLPVGALSDPKGREGMHALCFDLFDEGTRELDKAQLRGRLDQLGARLSTYAGEERAGISLQVLRRNADDAVALLRDVLRAPGLREDDFARLVEQATARLKQAKASPSGIAALLWDVAVWGANHPYARLTSEASLARLRRADCAKLAASLDARGARVFAVGAWTEPELRAALEPLLQGFRGRAAKPIVVGPARPAIGTLYFVDVPGAEQSEIRVGHPGPDRRAADYEAASLMAAILGGGFSSRINMNLREDKGWAYGARGGFAYRPQGGSFVASSSVRTDATRGAVEEIVAEIRRMRAADVQPDELARERDGVLLSLPASFATGERTASTLRGLRAFDLPLDYYDGYQDRIRATDVAAVRKAAVDHLRESDLQVLVVGDGATVRADLQALAASGALGRGGFIELDADGKRLAAPPTAKERP
jgi:predicted Zn-dependent peptidase